VEGFLFGHEGEDEVVVDSAFTSVYNSANLDTEVHNIVNKKLINNSFHYFLIFLIKFYFIFLG
jgi:hypothetical protein